MSAEKAPAFQFYPRDYLTDPNVIAMTLEQQGAYWKLCSLCWLEGALPADEAMLAKLLRVTPKRFAVLWPGIAVCFREQDGRLIHPRLERERQEQAEYRAACAAGGRKGADTRRRGRLTLIEGTMQGATKVVETALQPGTNTSPSSASSPSEVPPTPKGEAGGAERVWETFRALMDRYRHASLALNPSRKDCDWAIQLAAEYPDPDWFAKIAEVYVRSDHRDICAKPRCLGLLHHWASWCEGELRAAGYAPNGDAV